MEPSPASSGDERSLYGEGGRLRLAGPGGGRGERARRMLGLKGPLNAGIVGQAEYRERIEQIRRQP